MNITRLFKQHPVLSFCLLTLLWSFGWWSLIPVVIPIGTAMAMPQNPFVLALMVIGGVGPSLVGLVLTRIVGGKGSTKALLGRLGQWRGGWWWQAILVPYGVNAAVMALYTLTGGNVSTAHIAGLLGPAILFTTFSGLSEEFGRRGFLLPQLQRRHSPLVSSLLIALVWGGMWHLYDNYVGEYGDDGWWGMAMNLLVAPMAFVALAVLLTTVYNHTRGSMLLCVLFHASITSSSLVLSIDYPSSEAQLFWTAVSVLLWWIVAGAVVLVERRHMARPEMRLQPA